MYQLLISVEEGLKRLLKTCYGSHTVQLPKATSQPQSHTHYRCDGLYIQSNTGKRSNNPNSSQCSLPCRTQCPSSSSYGQETVHFGTCKGKSMNQLARCSMKKPGRHQQQSQPKKCQGLSTTSILSINQLLIGLWRTKQKILRQSPLIFLSVHLMGAHMLDIFSAISNTYPCLTYV